MEEKLNVKKKKLLINNIVRIDFLKEQSIIAKKLGIKVSQINVEKIGNNYLPESSEENLLSNYNQNTSYYLRGHVAIDEEIRLTKRRNYKNVELIQLQK